MTTKRQARICVERNLSDQEIVDMTGCHIECVEYVRAWGRGERVEKRERTSRAFAPLESRDSSLFRDPSLYRIAPRRIHVKATMPDGEVREASFPEPLGGVGYHEQYWASLGDMDPPCFAWTCDRGDLKHLRVGRAFRTREEALECDKAMIYISGGETE